LIAYTAGKLNTLAVEKPPWPAPKNMIRGEEWET